MDLNFKITNKTLMGISETILGNYWMQEYYKIIEFFSISVLICLLLACIAYGLSMSGKKDLEKLSEYECGFEPFDSGTRLPFDIHFYIVGILFLIFDVEIAIMFPWVLGLKVIGWFGFYCMILFLLILTLGFVYEWHRGALIWPHKFVSKFKNVKAFTPLTLWHMTDYFIPLMHDLMDRKTVSNSTPRPTNEGNDIDIISINISSDHFIAVLPELFIFSLICIVLIFIAVNLKISTREQKKMLAIKITSWMVWGLLFSISLYIFNPFAFGTGQLIFNKYAIIDLYTTIVKITLILTTIFILLCSDNYILTRQRYLVEFPIILVLATFFMLILVSSFNLLTMFIGIVGFSISLYVLILFDCTEHSAREAGIKYYYLSVYSSGFIAFGIFLLYLLFGSINFGDLSFFLTQFKFYSHINNLDLFFTFDAEFGIIGIAFCSILIGFLFKLAAFPCHFWASEIYEGSSDIVMAYFILPVKIATFGFFIRLLNYVFADIAFIWQPLLIVAAIGSMIWGCFMAFYERRLKRFIAYTSINQMGFLLIGLCCCTFEGNVSSLLYLFIYILMNVAFLCIILNTFEIENYRSLTYLSDFKVFGEQNFKNGYSFLLTLVIFSMAGIPPLAGFFGKYYLLISAFNSQLYFLVFIGLLTSLLSTYYYLSIIKKMLFENSSQSESINIKHKYKTFIKTKFHNWDLSFSRPLLYFIFLSMISFLSFYTFFNNTIIKFIFLLISSSESPLFFQEYLHNFN